MYLYTREEALQAIRSRLSENMNNLQLKKLGPLSQDPMDDIDKILKQTEPPTSVSVLFLKEDQDSILAVFPYHMEVSDRLLCYSYNDQHSNADRLYCAKLKEATNFEFDALYKELRLRGYLLTVLNDTGFKL